MSVDAVRTVDDLRDQLDRGAKVKFVFFWGHTRQVPGQLDASCLSNWYEASFEVDGVSYPTAEHFIMAEKAKLFHDSERLREIHGAKSPGKAKALG